MKTMSILERMLFLTAACAAICLGSAGQAGTLTTGAYSGDAVTISYLGNTEDTSALVFEDATFNGAPIPDFWCIDLIDHVPYPAWSLDNYTKAPFRSAPLTFSLSQVSNLETLFSDYYSGALVNADSAAAFQLAIWDVLFDDDHNLSTAGPGGFGVLSGPSAVITQAQLETNSALGAQHTYTLFQLVSSAGNQNFVYPGPLGQSAPEPTGLALLGAGLVAMMFVTRRRSSNVRLA